LRDADRLGALEAILFASADPVSVKQVVDAMEGQVEPAEALSLIEELQERYERQARGILIERVAEGFRFITRPIHAPFVRNFLKAQNLRKLSGAAVESLAIVAYKQPVTAAEVGTIRGTESTPVLKGLMEKKLIRIAGRKNVVGRPLLYTTTKEFLVHFSLNSLADLPTFRELNEVFREEVRQESLFKEDGAKAGTQDAGGDAFSQSPAAAEPSPGPPAEPPPPEPAPPQEEPAP
jgi:segregation and condensation protein B